MADEQANVARDEQSNISRGHKANLSNKNTSEESKEHSKEYLHSVGEDEYLESHGYTTEKATHSDSDSGNHSHSADHGGSTKEDHIPKNVHDDYALRGHKATLSNPHTSEAAKQHSREILQEADQGEA